MGVDSLWGKFSGLVFWEFLFVDGYGFVVCYCLEFLDASWFLYIKNHVMAWEKFPLFYILDLVWFIWCNNKVNGIVLSVGRELDFIC